MSTQTEKKVGAKRGAPKPAAQKRKTIMTLDRLAYEKKETALNVFAIGLQDFLSNREHADAVARPETREKVMERVNKALGYTEKTGFDVRQFDNLMKALFHDGNIRIATRTLPVLSTKIRDRFKGVEATVCAGTSRRSFARVATVEVLRLMCSIGEYKALNGEPLYVGLVSGSTTKTVIDELCASDDWMKDFGTDPTKFPEVIVFALNVSFTRPEYLPSHAMILAQRLADAINEAARKEKARAYGLNAELIVEKGRLDDVDKMPQTRDVLAFTEPYRVGKSTEPNETKLDIVLTGVGQWNPEMAPQAAPERAHAPEKDEKAAADEAIPVDVAGSDEDCIVETCSIFQNLVRGFSNLNGDIFRQRHVVGDLGFTPLDADGHRVILQGRKSEGTEYLAYSAAGLDILDAMVSTENKAVVLLAQSTPQKNKIPILYASLAGSRAHDPRLRRHVSHLIIDEHTAQELYHYSSTSLP
jgi:hypothetical protein